MSRNLQEVGASAHKVISEMVAPLLDADENEDTQEYARECVLEDVLSLEVLAKGASMQSLAPFGYELLLATGGPAVRIVGDLDDNCEPETARLEVQDWGEPWTEVARDTEALMAYVRCFYFGEP